MHKQEPDFHLNLYLFKKIDNTKLIICINYCLNPKLLGMMVKVLLQNVMMSENHQKGQKRNNIYITNF